MTRVERHSLWLMSESEVYNKLGHLISTLSDRYGTPDFLPHVTLIGQAVGPEDEILSKTSDLASSINPYEISLNKVDCLNEFFRSLFVRAEETKEVIAANERAREIFGRRDDASYMPHLSLLYGDFPAETKEEIISDIGNCFDISFEVKSIHLFSTAGEPKDWHRVGEFPLRLTSD